MESHSRTLQVLAAAVWANADAHWHNSIRPEPTGLVAQILHIAAQERGPKRRCAVQLAIKVRLALCIAPRRRPITASPGLELARPPLCRRRWRHCGTVRYGVEPERGLAGTILVDNHFGSLGWRHDCVSSSETVATWSRHSLRVSLWPESRARDLDAFAVGARWLSRELCNSINRLQHVVAAAHAPPSHEEGLEVGTEVVVSRDYCKLLGSPR